MQGNAECTWKSTMGRTLGTQKNVFSDFSALYEGTPPFRHNPLGTQKNVVKGDFSIST